MSHRRGSVSTETSFEPFVQLLEKSWSAVAADDSLPPIPCFLDVLSGPRFPLSIAFAWAGWNVLQPVDLELNHAFDVTNVSTQHAIAKVLPSVHVVSCAMDCSTKSRIRDIPLSGGSGPKPLRSSRHPRGLPGLPEVMASRVAGDNCCSDFVLAIQHVMNTHGRGAFRENPRNSYHWEDPCEKWLSSQPGWWSWDYDACCLFASRRKKQRIVHNMETMRQLPTLVCGHIHDPREWTPSRRPDGSMFFPSKEESEYTAHLCFTLVVACSHWAVQQGFAVQKIQRLPPMQVSGLETPATPAKLCVQSGCHACNGFVPWPCVRVQCPCPSTGV